MDVGLRTTSDEHGHGAMPVFCFLIVFSFLSSGAKYSVCPRTLRKRDGIQKNKIKKFCCPKRLFTPKRFLSLALFRLLADVVLFLHISNS